MMDEQYSTFYTKDLNFIGSAPSKLTLTIYLSDEEITTSYFGRYESIVLVINDKEYTFTPEEFIDGMNRMARTAKRVRVPYQSHVAIGHYECGACGETVEPSDKYCSACGAGLEDE